MGGGQRTLVRVSSLFQPCGFWGCQTQDTRPGSKCLYPLGHLTSPSTSVPISYGNASFAFLAGLSLYKQLKALDVSYVYTLRLSQSSI